MAFQKSIKVWSFVKFIPIIDTDGSTHYSVGMYITKLLGPSMQNFQSLKYWFDAAEKTKAFPPESIEKDGYMLLPFSQMFHWK